MTLLDKLPGMADDALSNLHANAVRLGAAGSPGQRASAAQLLPALEAELAARKAAKRERLAQASKTRTRKPAPAAEG